MVTGKGGPEEGEGPFACAQREFWEETHHVPPCLGGGGGTTTAVVDSAGLARIYIDLGHVKQSNK